MCQQILGVDREGNPLQAQQDKLFDSVIDQEELKQASEVIVPVDFITEDPSKLYQIIAKLGSGGFAKVFLVKRLTDNAKFALKFMEPKSDKERGLIRNELAVM